MLFNCTCVCLQMAMAPLKLAMIKLQMLVFFLTYGSLKSFIEYFPKSLNIHYNINGAFAPILNGNTLSIENVVTLEGLSMPTLL